MPNMNNVSAEEALVEMHANLRRLLKAISAAEARSSVMETSARLRVAKRAGEWASILENTGVR